MPEGSRSPTSVDVARAAGVSQSTVSRVVNGNVPVSPEVKAAVEAAIERLGYRPNLSARSLVTSRTGSVGVVLGDLTNGYYAELLHTISGELSRAGYRTLMLSDRTGDPQDLLATLGESNVDGIVVTTSLLPDEDEARIVSLGVPSVTLGPNAVAGADSVTPDNVAGGRLAAKHLLDLGHRRIGVIAGPLTSGSIRDRHDGYLAELASRGVDANASLFARADMDYQRAYAAAMSMLTAATPPTAIFCHTDLMAMATLNAALALGLRVPEHLSVLGFDDVAMSSWEVFRLTTIRQPIRDMALDAVAALLRRFSAPDAPSSRILLPCTLIERATTRALRTA
jgi:LacI family transcriptional regulator